MKVVDDIQVQLIPYSLLSVTSCTLIIVHLKEIKSWESKILFIYKQEYKKNLGCMKHFKKKIKNDRAERHDFSYFLFPPKKREK